jgi:hypothetical protein
LGTDAAAAGSVYHVEMGNIFVKLLHTLSSVP